MRNPTRRGALTAFAAVAGALAARPAGAIGPDDETGIALLRHGAGATLRPGAVEQLLWEATKRTSIDARERPAVVEPESPEVFRHPLIAWLGEEACPPLSDAAVARLGRYLRAGGCLYIDDASPPGVDGFDQSVRREVERLLPGRVLSRVSNDHTIYRSFFLLERPFGRTARQNFLEGVELDDRTAVFYGRNDLFGAFGRDAGGSWRLPVEPGGDEQREMAFRMGINLLMYATCLSYKRDQVHVTEILRRRKWRVDEGGVVK
ncbi:DUF4159 domain-containing protein [Myxococcota bacterium]|nr:DUF4159 domain-containing protein [Myxococcota bacterium]